MWNSLRIRLTTIFIGLAVGPLLVVGAILAQRTYAVEQVQALALQSQVARNVSAEVEAFFQGVVNDLDSLGGEIRSLKEPDRAQQLSLMLSALSSGPSQDAFDELILLDGQGQEQVRLARQEITPSQELVSRAGRDEFERPKANRDTYFSPVRFDENSGAAFITIAVPLFEPRSVQLSGVLVAEVRFAAVGALIAGVPVGDDQTVYATDAEGRVIAHPGRSLEEARNAQIVLPAPASMQPGLDGASVALAVAKVQLGEQAITVVAETPVSKALALAITTAITLAIVIAAALVIAGLLGILAVRQIVQPIEGLVATAQRIAAGDLSRVAVVKTSDELGLLARAFNTMTAQLRDLIQSLEERVTERTYKLTQAQEHTKALLGQVREASRIARLASFDLDLEAQTVTLDDSFYELLGQTAPATPPLSVTEAVARFAHPEDGARLLAEIRREIETGAADDFQLEGRFVHATGALRHMTLRFQIQRDADGRAVRARGAAQDITESKQAEENLLRFRYGLEQSTDAVFMTDLQGNILYVNPAFEKTYGFPAAEALGQTPRILKSGVIPLEQYHHFWQALLNKQAVAGEIVNKTKDGRLIPVEGSNTPVVNASGQIIGFMGTHRDITERKRSEAALAKRAAELEITTQLATSIARSADPDEMLQTVVDQVKTSFSLYHAHIYVLNEARDSLILAAGAGESGRQMLARKHAIPANREHSLVARAAATRQGVVANDVSREPDFLPNPLLPETRSELAVPMLVADRVLGVLDVQSSEIGHFTPEDVRVQTILAAQVAVALENARSRAQSADALHELDMLTRRLTREGWDRHLSQAAGGRLGYAYADEVLMPLAEAEALNPGPAVVQPIMVRGETVGRLVAAQAGEADAEVNVILAAVAQSLSTHLDNLRLSEQTQSALAQTEELYAITAQLNTAGGLDDVVRIVTTASGAAGGALFLLDLDPAGRPVEMVYSAGWPQINPLLGSLGARLPVRQFPEAELLIQDPDRPLFFQDLEKDARVLPATREFNRQLGVQASAYLPLMIAGRWVGLLALSWTTPQGFSEQDVQLHRTMAAQAAVVVNNRLLFEQTRRRADREAVINAISQKIQGTVTVQSALETAVQELGQALKARRASVALAVAGEGQTAANGHGNGQAEAGPGLR